MADTRAPSAPSSPPDWPFLPGPAGPVQISRAEGCYLYDAEGRAILDAAGGAIVVNIGHGRPEPIEAAAQAMREATFVVPTFATPHRTRLVERLREKWLPPHLTRIYLASGGSESTDAAVRLARSHHVAAGRPERWKILARDVSYHGATVTMLAIGGHEARRRDFGPLSAAHPKAPPCYCLRCPFGRTYPECELACADAVEQKILEEGPDTVAAFIGEPIVGTSGGALVPPDGYWQRVAEICRRHGVLLIADEVMTGFGRTGRRFGVEHFDLEPDILVGGKGLSGGYAPIGGLYASDAVVEPLARAGRDLMFYTYGAHPAACAASDAVLEIMEREDLVSRAASTGEKLRKRLAGLEAHPHVAQVRGRGLLLAIELVEDRETLEPFPAEARLTARVVAEGMRRGVFFYPGGAGPARDIIGLGPPLVIGEQEIDTIASVLEESIDAAVARAREIKGPPASSRS